MKDSEPHIINGYRVLRLLGQGSMGKVYLVTEQTQTDTLYALKRLLPGRGLETRLHRFRREIRSLSRINHPNIVRIFDTGMMEDTPFFVMEYVSGEPLSEFILRRRHLIPLEKTLSIIEQVSEALAYLHDHKIIHRDLKPSNIMLTTTGTAKLTDFGLVKLVETTAESMMTETGAIVGTVRYMSPEQAMGKAVDYRTDIYSLGVLFYIMATGHLPFQGKDPLSLIWRVIKDKPAAPVEKKPGLPIYFSEMIEKLIAKDPSNRFDSMQQVLRTLRQHRESFLSEVQVIADVEEDVDYEAETLLHSQVRIAKNVGDDRAAVSEEQNSSTEDERFSYIDYHHYLQRVTQWMGSRNFTGREPGILVLLGEEGVGKSRLIREIMTQSSAKGLALYYLRVQCGESLLDRLITLFQQTLDANHEESSIISATPPYIKDYLLQCSIFPNFDSSLARSRLEWELMKKRLSREFGLVRELLAFAARQPVLLILDDVHKYDQADVRWLRQFIETRAILKTDDGTPDNLLLLISCHKEAFLKASAAEQMIHTLARKKLVEVMELDGPSNEDAARIFTAFIGAQRCDASFAEYISRVGMGNLLFIRELARYLSDQRMISVQDGVVRLMDKELQTESQHSVGEGMPESITEVLTARVTQFSSSQFEVLYAAAVLGSYCNRKSLAAITGMEDEQLRIIIESLVVQEVLAPEAQRTDCFHFAHQLIEDVLSTLMDDNQRAYLHAKAARYLVDLLESDEAEAREHHTPSHTHAWIIAEHFLKAGEKEAAAEYFLDAARYAVSKASYDQGQAFCRQGLECLEFRENFENTEEPHLEDSPRKALLNSLALTLDELIGIIFLLQGEFSKAESHFTQKRTKGKWRDNPLALIRLILWKSWLAILSNKPQKADEALADARSLFNDGDKTKVAIELKKKWIELKLLLALVKGNGQAVKGELEALMKTQLLLPPNMLKYTSLLSEVGWICLQAGRTEQAMQYYQSALKYLSKYDQKMDTYALERGLFLLSRAKMNDEQCRQYFQQRHYKALQQANLCEEAWCLHDAKNGNCSSFLEQSLLERRMRLLDLWLPNPFSSSV